MSEVGAAAVLGSGVSRRGSSSGGAGAFLESGGRIRGVLVGREQGYGQFQDGVGDLCLTVYNSP